MAERNGYNEAIQKTLDKFRFKASYYENYWLLVIELAQQLRASSPDEGTLPSKRGIMIRKKVIPKELSARASTFYYPFLIKDV